MRKETFCFELVDSGDGPVQYVTADPEGLQSALGLAEKRRVQVVPLEEFVAIAEDEDNFSPEQAGVIGLTCCLEPDRPWNGSVCELVTGFDEAAMLAELARMEIIMETKRLRDEGGI